MPLPKSFEDQPTEQDVIIQEAGEGHLQNWWSLIMETVPEEKWRQKRFPGEKLNWD